MNVGRSTVKTKETNMDLRVTQSILVNYLDELNVQIFSITYQQS